jgi:uncharacterized protein (DUF2235 family)
VWFAGVHSDVGGGYAESESQLSKIALRWMLCEAKQVGLEIDPERESAILGGKAPYVAPDPTTENQHESLRRAWWIAELWPKIITVKDTDDWRRSIYFNLGRRRYIADGVTVHESVEQRLTSTKFRYQPKNLPAQRSVIGDLLTPQ